MKATAIVVCCMALILLLTLWLLSHAFILIRLLPILVFLALVFSILVLVWVIIKVRRKL